MSSTYCRIRPCSLTVAVLCGVLFGIWLLRAFAQVPKAFESAAQAFGAGNLSEAVRLARAGLEKNPNEMFGLNLLAVALDQQKKYAEAEPVYLQALRLGRTPTLLNNLANHYFAMGKKAQARKYYLEALVLDPNHVNAHYQLAVLALDGHHATEALDHLRALPEAEKKKPATILLTAQALFETGHPQSARRVLEPLAARRDTDVTVAFSLGVLYYREKLYADAVSSFEAALRQSPGDFDILYNLGLAYYHAGQKQRSAEVLQRAIQVDAHSADALYRLAVVSSELGHDEAATELLVRARELAPDRPELSLLLARECQKQQFWLDASEAYEVYLRAKPDDWAARRELALVYGRLTSFEQALAQMDRYVAARPRDAEGYYLRGLIAWHLKRSAAATRDFQRALALKPRMAQTWSRLGEIAREENNLPEAARCYRRALAVDSSQPNALYGLGQVLNNLGQYAEAVPFLQKAVEVSPDEPAPYYQLSMAYRRLGKAELAQVELGRFQELRQSSTKGKFVHTGIVAYVREGLKLSESERRAREMEYLERAAAIKPGDPAISARLLDGYLSLHKNSEAEEVIRKWLDSDPSGQAALRVGQILARHGDDDRAIPYFAQASQKVATRFRAQLGLAEAQFHLQRYQAALEVLASLAPPPDNADFHLLHGAILDKLQRFDEALAAYQRAIRAQPKAEAPYFELGLFLVRHRAYDAAAEDFHAAQKVLPQSLKLAMAEAVALNLAGHHQESRERLRAIEARWPEQDWPYVLAGISAYTARNFEDARREFEKAAALESDNPLAYYYLALLDSQSPQASPAETLRWAEMAVAGDPDSAQARLLLGRLYRRLGRNAEARTNLEEAVRLQPDLADAHYLLGRVYAQMGDKARADAETRESERWHREIHQASPEDENILRLLVRVEPAAQ